ncbi:kinase-like domain-containing protein [Dipodascopsis tothii]|uniref:kinase-like domain-containing protein n=1 Tax=Dipodascopsis tothii TaxID=44089 RepID=UPI0034CF531F
MENGGHTLLLRFIDSAHFSLFMCISYLARYADNIGIHFYLCQKLRTYPYPEIEFFLPQLCQIVLTVPTESVALEDFVLEMANRSTHSAVLTFWLLQAHLEELSHDPESTAFLVCRRLYNKVQYVLFNIGESPSQKIRENSGPALVLASALMGAVGMPMLPQFMAPITLSQARKPRFRVFHLIPKIGRSKSFSAASSPTIVRGPGPAPRPSRLGRTKTTSVTVHVDPLAIPSEDDDSDDGAAPAAPKPSNGKQPARRPEDDDDSVDEELRATGFPLDKVLPPSAERAPPRAVGPPSPIYGLDMVGISSLPDLRSHRLAEGHLTASMSATSITPHKTHGHYVRPVPTQNLSPAAKTKLLKTNYFRYETSFAYALQAISTRLRLVPKPARLSALRAEITLLNKELPAEVDIPTILDSDTYGPHTKLHKVVRISPSEATILNSAERVPFLMMIEILREETTFDLETPHNQALLASPPDYRNLFNLGYRMSSSAPLHLDLEQPKVRFQADVLTESELGDISTSTFTDEAGPSDVIVPPLSSTTTVPVLSPTSVEAQLSPRTSELSFASAYQIPKSVPTQQVPAKVNDAALHIRTAATMLAQLDWASSAEANGHKVSKDEILQIKSRIITSMQHLEDESVFVEKEAEEAALRNNERRRHQPSNSFSTSINILNSSARRHSRAGSISSMHSVESALGIKEAGERRLENDMKTGAIEGKGTFSSVGFGEEWSAKRERVRSTSPFGHLPNWELVSVIAKTGSDLRQEAFACQLILAMKRIWEDAEVDVWVRRMVILITGASSGLVETITNAVSIHSLKKALATSAYGPGNHPKSKIPSLKSYFVQAFGDPNSARYKAAQLEFIKSLAAYSLISYVLQIKDRHNGNILLDNEGHIIHIDFGFLLSNSPGSVGFEAAPFKLTHEYVEVMGGPKSNGFELFRGLLKHSFKTMRKHADDIVVLVEMMQKESPLPCFISGDATAHLLRQRFQLHMSETEVDNFVDNVLIGKSLGSFYTRLYDQYQFITQGIYS